MTIRSDWGECLIYSGTNDIKISIGREIKEHYWLGKMNAKCSNAATAGTEVAGLEGIENDFFKSNFFENHYFRVNVESITHSLSERSAESDVLNGLEFGLTEFDVIRRQVLFHMVRARCSRQWNHSGPQGESKHDLSRRTSPSL
jgi:hypothetical protein